MWNNLISASKRRSTKHCEYAEAAILPIGEPTKRSCRTWWPNATRADPRVLLQNTLPRLVGKQQHRIDYHHLIWELLRKPGAFAAYRYRDELFPTTCFRQAYDQLVKELPARADHEYVRVLHLAASTAESEVETALSLLLEAGSVPTATAVRELVGVASPQPIPQMQAPTLDLSPYDRLLPSRRIHA